MTCNFVYKRLTGQFQKGDKCNKSVMLHSTRCSLHQYIKKSSKRSHNDDDDNDDDDQIGDLLLRNEESITMQAM